MAIVIRVNGNGSGSGFLVAQDGSRTFPVPVGLKTNDGSTVTATLEVSPNNCGATLSATTVTVGPTEQDVSIFATVKSGAAGDTILKAKVTGNPDVTFTLTGIANPELVFRGRAQVRFPTNPDYYNDPRGTAGLAIALPGEPDFVPADSVPTTIDKPVGRAVRFNNPVALRSHAADPGPIAVTVTKIQGSVGLTTAEFTTGDPVIGAKVDLGPNTYLAGNRPINPTDPAPPAENWADGYEPMALFELHIAGYFSGTSAASTDRPIANGFIDPMSPTELTAYGIPTLASFESGRKTALLADYNPMSAADKAATAGLNLAQRIAWLGGDTTAGIPNQYKPGWGFRGKEEYDGIVNGGLNFTPSLSPSMLFLSGYSSLHFFAKLFSYHGDDLCIGVDGTLGALTAITAFQSGVFNATTATTAAFAGIPIPGFTPAAVTGVIGGGGAAEKLVVTVGAGWERLVVSKATVSNPAAAPSSWILSARGATVVAELLPSASVLGRDMFFRILPPGDPASALGVCEGMVPVPAPAVGLARLFVDGAAWRLLLHAGTAGAAGFTYDGTFSGSTATVVPGCVSPTVEVLTPDVNFGSVEEGLVAHREVVLVNHGATNVTVSLPALAAPFGAPLATSVVLAAGGTGVLLVAFTAGPPGMYGPTAAVLTSAPPVSGTLSVTLRGTSVAVTTSDVVLVLDRSGSMVEPAFQGFRPLTKTALRNEASQVFVDLLRDNDRVGMVRFDTDAQIHLALMQVSVAGDESGRLAATSALLSPDLNPAAMTSIGDGMILANTMLTAVSSATRHAMVVLTDGKETADAYLASVSLGAGVKAYALGLGLPENINIDTLSAVTGNTGGYLLVTGEMDDASRFRLHKYFAQVLSGISGDQIVLDPQFVIEPGEVQEQPFEVTEADGSLDVVLLTYHPGLQFDLVAPDGTILTAATAAAEGVQFVVGKMARYYRMALPALGGNPSRSTGQWRARLRLPGDPQALVARATARQQLVADRKLQGNARTERGLKAALEASSRRGVPYTLLVRARSSIQFRTAVRTEGSRSIITAWLSAFGLPSSQASIRAEVTRPDGSTFAIPLTPKEAGRFEAVLDDGSMGNFQVSVKAAGTTPGGFALRREQTMTVAHILPVAPPAATAPGPILDTSAIEKLLHDLLIKIGTGQPALPSWLIWAVAVLIVLLLLIIILLVRQ